MASAQVGCGAAAKSAPPAPYPSSASSADGRFGATTEAVTKAGGARADQAAAPSENASPAPVAPPAPPPPPGMATKDAASEARPREAGEEPSRDPELVVYEARFVMAVHIVDAAIASVERLARDNGGWVSREQNSEIVVRVPRGRFRPLVETVGSLGDVLSRDISAVDVTDEHVDLEVRIKNARAMQARLHELLERAAVKDALEIEKELHRVTEELERMEGRLKLLRDKVAYSTVSVSFSARARSIEPGSPRLPFSWLGSLGLPSLLSLTEGSGS